MAGDSVLGFRERLVAVQEQFANAAAEAVAQAKAVVFDAVAAINHTLVDRATAIGSWRPAKPAEAGSADPDSTTAEQGEAEPAKADSAGASQPSAEQPDPQELGRTLDGYKTFLEKVLSL